MKARTFLFNPFEKIAGSKALIIGLAAIMATGIAGFFGRIHLDGIIDMHGSQVQMPMWIYLSEGVLNWLVLSVCLLIPGAMLSKTQYRIIDIFGTIAFARWPFLPAAVLMLLVPMDTVTQYFMHEYLGIGEEVQPTTMDFILFAVFSVVMLLVLIWVIILFYRAYSISFNIKGTPAVVSYVVAFIVAEIVVKFILTFLYKPFI
jgi:hypothetical protein